MVKRFFKRFILILALIGSIILVLGSVCGIVLLYGPFESLRDLWITTAMETFHHRYLARWFFTPDYIELVVDRNKPQEPEEEIDLDLIHIGSDTEPASEPETEALPATETETETEVISETETATETEVITETEPETEPEPLIVIDDLKGKNELGATYIGYMMTISDPTLVRVGVSDKLGSYGQKLDSMCESYDAIAGLNGGGFSDQNGTGNGGYAEGVVMKDGEIIWNSTPGKTHSVIGITYEGKLVLKKMTDSELKESDIRDCLEFSPFLIVNGVATKVGTTGVHPRSAIGQTADGKFLFLCIEGRSSRSAGATQKDVIDIMLEYGAVNCANLDGGSSSTLIHEGKLVNKTSSSADMRYLATAFVVLDPDKIEE